MQLRKQIKPLTFLFQENAAVLFRHKVNRAERKIRKANLPEKEKTCRSSGPEWKDNPNLENLPDLLRGFADDLKEFQKCLAEFREVVDSPIATVIESFEADLKVCEISLEPYIFSGNFFVQYWVSCLRDYECKSN